MPDRDPSTPGRRPYGTHPGEAPILARMIRLRESGRTWQDIADRLNASGATKRNGKAWAASAVARIVTRAVRG